MSKLAKEIAEQKRLLDRFPLAKQLLRGPIKSSLSSVTWQVKVGRRKKRSRAKK